MHAYMDAPMLILARMHVAHIRTTASTEAKQAHTRTTRVERGLGPSFDITGLAIMLNNDDSLNNHY